VSSLMAALLPFSPLAAVPPPLGAKVLTSDPPPIVREKAMQRHERAGREDESWPPPKYKQLKKLAPKAEMTNLVLVLGGMVNQKDLDLAGEWIKETGAHLMLYNNDASGTDDCKSGTSNGVWCGQSCDQLRLPPRTTCHDIANMGRAEGAYFKYVFDHYDVLEGKQIVFSGSTVSNEMRANIVPNLLRGPGNGDVVPRCFLGEYHSQVTAWDVWWFGFTQKCEPGHGQNDQWTACNWCRDDPSKDGETVNGTDFHSGAQVCGISYEDCFGGSATCKQRPQTVCAADPNTVGRWLLEHAPEPGGDSQSPACYRGAFRVHGEALRKRPREQYRNMHLQLNKCSNPEASHFVERGALYLFASL